MGYLTIEKYSGLMPVHHIFAPIWSKKILRQNSMIIAELLTN